MKLTISDKAKRDVFISIFHLLKQSTSAVTLMFLPDHLYIQGMDNSHVCLFDIKIMADWFTTYVVNESDLSTVSMDTNIFHMILSVCQDQHSIIIYYEGEPDTIDIDITNENSSKDFNKHFRMPLSSIDTEIMHIPETEYDADISIPSKKFHEITSQLSMFGDVMNVKCSEESLSVASNGMNGEMTVDIPIEDLTEYSICEGEKIDVSFSLNYVHKMCLNTKLAPEVQLSILINQPMRIKYDLGDESRVLFYIAPKIED